jgi:hypothetical protein
MTTPRAQYINELKDHFRYGVAWLPSRKLNLGDVGVIDDDEFVPLGSLSRFNIPFDVQKSDAAVDLKHYSKNSVSVAFKAKGAASMPGSTLASADAGVVVEFSDEDAVAFEAAGCRETRIVDQIKLGATILDLYHKDKWPSDWVVITELVEVDSLTVLISSSNKGKVEIKVNGDFSPGGATLANLGADIEISFSRDMNTQILGRTKMTPLLHASGIKGVFSKSFGQKLSVSEMPADLDGALAAYDRALSFQKLTQ